MTLDSGMRDTSDSMLALQLAAIRRSSAAERLTHVFQLSELTRQLALSQLRIRYPDRTTVELVELMLGQRLIPPSEPPQ